MALLKSGEKYTYADYVTWNDGERYELVDGVPHMMSPSPTKWHQRISLAMASQLRIFLKGKPCEVFLAPFDVRLNSDSGDNTVVQPDVLVVCDSSKLDGDYCNGAPDFIVEILSPSTARYDKELKLQKYLEAGVREYWLIDPIKKTVLTYVLHGKLYIARLYGNTGTAPVSVLKNCQIDLDDLFTI
jgi:Uma2 family endonuclease